LCKGKRSTNECQSDLGKWEGNHLQDLMERSTKSPLFKGCREGNLRGGNVGKGRNLCSRTTNEKRIRLDYSEEAIFKVSINGLLLSADERPSTPNQNLDRE